MTTHSYLVHGLQLTLTAEDTVLAALQARLGRFPAGTDARLPQLRFVFYQVSDPGRLPVARPAGTSRSVLDLELGEATYYDKTDQFYMDFGKQGQVLGELGPGRVLVSYQAVNETTDWFLSHVCFTAPLTELLKRRGLYMVHAAGLAVDGKGLLVAGQSGSGKTTLTLTLVRAGFGFLADDTVFLRATPAGKELRVLAFPDEIDVTAHTASFFPEIAKAIGAAPATASQKNSVCATRVYGVAPCWECAPAVIVFPQASGAERSVVTPLPKSEAFLQLLCNLVRTEPRSSQAHLDALAALVRDCRCYRLEAGRDFDTLPKLLRTLLE